VVVTVGDGPGVAVSVGVGVGVLVGVAGGKVDDGDGVSVGCNVFTVTGVGVSIFGRGVFVAGIFPVGFPVGVSVGMAVALAVGAKVGTTATEARVGIGSDASDPKISGSISSGSTNNTTRRATTPTAPRTKIPAIIFMSMFPDPLDAISFSDSML
jgi:hypothetical protein